MGSEDILAGPVRVCVCVSTTNTIVSYFSLLDAEMSTVKLEVFFLDFPYE